MPRTEARRARRTALSPAIRAGGTLVAPDYVDAFAIDVDPGSRSAEQWARRCLEDAPPAVRWFLLTSWRFGLGVRLGPYPSAEHVLGWAIVGSTAEQTILGVESALIGPAQLVCRVESARVVLGTLIRFERAAARPIWSVVGLVHRRILAYLLTRAANAPAGAAGR